MTQIRHSHVLITGGASGIGRLLGEQMLAAGAASLIVWDINAPLLAECVAQLQARGHVVHGFVVDVTQQSHIDATVAQMNAQSLTVDILVNNAGIVVGKAFADYTHEHITREMAINALAPMHITLALMPMLRQRPAAHIVNIASAASMLGNPRMSVYVASKWALAGWSDSLRIELAQLTPVIRVTRINPFYIATGMFHGVRSPIIPILTPEVVIPRMLRAIEGNALSLQLPWIVNILPFVRSILPSALFDLIVGEWLGVYHTMDAFTGRQNSPQRPE
jgi:hypothetical protein